MNSQHNHRFHTLVVHVENKPGVLARVAGLFSRRAFNIDSLAVAPTADDRFSRITIVVDGESAPIDQIIKQLDKLVNVVDIAELDESNAVERELLLATVTVPPTQRSAIGFDESGFDLLVLEETDAAVTLSFSGSPARVDELEALLAPFGITDIQRTGTLALPKI